MKELTKKEKIKYRLLYDDGYEKKHTFEGTDIVWQTHYSYNKNNKIPIYTYRLYNRGTNDLLVLRYSDIEEKWEEIKLEQIENLYGFLWRLTGLDYPKEEKVNET
jgi:hypothetical protein